jgi:hypothetical protein
VDRKQRDDAFRARRDDLQDRLNEFGAGQPDVVAGAAKRRPRRALRPCILRRLRRDFPQLHQLVLDGQISPHRAAITAGFRAGRQPKLQHPIDRRLLSRHTVAHVGHR